MPSLLSIAIVVLIVLFFLGYFGRGRFPSCLPDRPPAMSKTRVDAFAAFPRMGLLAPEWCDERGLRPGGRSACGGASTADHPVHDDDDDGTQPSDDDALEVDARHVGDLQDRASQPATDHGTDDAQQDG